MHKNNINTKAKNLNTTIFGHTKIMDLSVSNILFQNHQEYLYYKYIYKHSK